MKRRKFIKHVGSSFAVPGFLSTLGVNNAGAAAIKNFLRMAADEGKKLLLINLDGGNDGLNTVVPMNSLSALNSVRRHVMLPESSIIPLRQSDLGLHPELKDLAALYHESRLGIIQNVGYPNQNFSHFRSTDIWMSGSDADQNLNSGWLGRYLGETYQNYPDAYPNEEMPDPLAVEIGYGSSLLFQGVQSQMSMVISNPRWFYELLDGVDEVVPDTKAGDKLAFVKMIARQSQVYGEKVKQAAENAKSQKEYPDSYLGQQLSVVSQLISGGLKTPIYMVRLGGFDTHEGQVDPGDKTKGSHADLLKELNDGIVSFVEDMDQLGLGDDVIGITFSEFGRRIVSNASNGTDHGAAAPMFVFGNKVKGGVIGSDPIVESWMNYEHNLEMEFDYRQIYASVLEQWFEADASKINNSLYKGYDTIPIIGEAVVMDAAFEKNRSLFVYPNPLNGSANISLDAGNNYIEIELNDMHGRLVQKIYRGQPRDGKIELNWNTANLKAGQYLVVARQKSGRQVFPVIKN